MGTKRSGFDGCLLERVGVPNSRRLRPPEARLAVAGLGRIGSRATGVILRRLAPETSLSGEAAVVRSFGGDACCLARATLGGHAISAGDALTGTGIDSCPQISLLTPSKLMCGYGEV